LTPNLLAVISIPPWCHGSKDTYDILLEETGENHYKIRTMDGDDGNYEAIDNNNDSYFVNLCDDNDNDNDNDNEEESWEQKQLKRAIEESIREASASTSASSQSRTTVATASSSSTASTSTPAATATATATLPSSLSLTEDEQLILAQTIQLSQIEQHEKERKESMMMDRAIKESHNDN
jgi:hypothetical protein